MEVDGNVQEGSRADLRQAFDEGLDGVAGVELVSLVQLHGAEKVVASVELRGGLEVTITSDGAHGSIFDARRLGVAAARMRDA